MIRIPDNVILEAAIEIYETTVGTSQENATEIARGALQRALAEWGVTVERSDPDAPEEKGFWRLQTRWEPING